MTSLQQSTLCSIAIKCPGHTVQPAASCVHTKTSHMPLISLQGNMLNRPTWQLVQMSLAESARLLMLSYGKLWQHWCTRLRFKCGNIGVVLQSDVWSLGCVLYEMATLRHPFDAPNMRQLATKVCVYVCPCMCTCMIYVCVPFCLSMHWDEYNFACALP